MPTNYARFLVGRHRTTAGNRQLGWFLAFVAGALNAGGFLAVQQYTSHVTGMLSALADNFALGYLDLVVDGMVAILAFLLGAICSAILVNFARRKAMASEYSLPLLLESALILCFGLLGARLASFDGLLIPFTVVLLCFIMGLQNAAMTKLSGAVIRTTHMTGTVTDLGIELGKLMYWNIDRGRPSEHHVRADRDRIVVLGGLLLAFLLGGISGAFGFKQVGYGFTVPLAVLLALISLVPAWDDIWHRKSRG
ncbi:YoaK family protein [Ottowia thiooxydans]|uniref:YoaK family protein n=1 Tax=Ottowia thiooxydans TaxID=219182 RepID=UPI0004913114|nr:YoaK family protein [Ottowia thiooxydans]